MEILIAVVHIVGAILTIMVLAFLVSSFELFLSQKSHARVRREIALQLGIRVVELDIEENAQQFLRTFADRISSELFRNRISDLIGSIVNALDILFSIVMALILIFTIYNLFDQGPGGAPIIWFALGVFLFWVLVMFAIKFVYFVLTGRHPSEAKTARKNLQTLNVV